MAKDTITWSRIHRTSAIVISKADRVLTLYRNGQKVLSYPVRLGFNGIREKRYQGDGATPEGRYRISGKRGRGQTQFYRALALDYPNEDDRRRYQLGRKMGQIPASRAIGGQIEIHGVENELMAQTLGCVMLDNPQMALLYEQVDKGTPITIVGALDDQNSVALTLATLDDRREEI
jgi:murein L,D-transpeptidase YafK